MQYSERAEGAAAATTEAGSCMLSQLMKRMHLPTIPTGQAVPPTAPEASTCTPIDADHLPALITAASLAAAAGRLRTAAATCAALLQRYPASADASLVCAEVLTAAGQPEAAVAVLQAALTAAKGSKAQPQQLQQPQHLQQQAPQQCVAKPSELLQQQHVSLLRQLAICQVASGQYEHALEACQEAIQCLDEQDTAQQLDLQTLAASALYPRGGAHAEAALQLVLEVLNSGAAVPASALQQYAAMMADKQLWGHVVKVTVQLTMRAPADQQAQRLLARAVKEPSGMQQLLQDVGLTSRSAAALVLFANSIKQQGAAQQAVQLYRSAVQLQPHSSSYALELARALELDYDYSAVLGVVLGLSKGNSNQSLGILSLKHIAGQQCFTVYAAHLHFKVCTGNWHDWSSSSSSSANRCLTHHRCSGGTSGTSLAAQSVKFGSTAASTSSSSSSNSQSCSCCASSGLHELDVLALLFTALKVLFIGGALPAAAELLQLCRVAWRTAAAAAGPLHRTHIRNEAAYAECIKQLLLQCPPPVVTDISTAAAAAATVGNTAAASRAAGNLSASQGALIPGRIETAAAGQVLPAAAAAGNMPLSSSSTSAVAAAATLPVYLCGDSHCLSGAWRCVTVAGQQRLLHPVLVTGLKIWHLRGSSEHYTKQQFWSAVSAIPAGSQVILLLGEIDCREGLLLAVEKLKYATLQEAAAATAAIYVAILRQLVQKQHLKVYVHPVPPVLDATRAAVQLFESTLRQAVQQVARTLPNGHLVYLDFFDQMLTKDGQSLEPQFKLDGMHLHPAYLSLLQAALNNI